MCVNDHCRLCTSPRKPSYIVSTKNYQFQWLITKRFLFLPPLAGVKLKWQPTCVWSVFSWQTGRSSGEIIEWFFIRHFIPDVAYFTSTGTPLAEASQQVKLGIGGRNPAVVDVTENVSRQLGMIICHNLLQQLQSISAGNSEINQTSIKDNLSCMVNIVYNTIITMYTWGLEGTTL